MSEIKDRAYLLKMLGESIELLTVTRSRMLYPFDFFEGLDVVEAKSINDLERLLDAAYATTTWAETPFDTASLAFLKNYSAVNYLYWNLTHKKIGGWCGLAGEFFLRLLYGYGVRARSLNYGLVKESFTHIVVLVELLGKEYVFDPYLGKYYIRLDGSLIPYEELMREIVNRTYAFEEVRVTSRKSVLVDGQCIEMGASSFESWVFESEYSRGLEYELRRLGYSRPIDLMMQWSEKGNFYA